MNISLSCLHIKIYTLEQYKMGNIFTLEQMQNARKNFADFDTFCSSFLSNVIGKQAYNKKVLQSTISEMASVSDEAFVVLCLENSMKRWEHEAKDPTTKRIDAVYTASPAEASKYGGWSNEGMRHFNTLQREIVPYMRMKSAKLEAHYLKHHKELKQPSKRKKKVKLPRNKEDIPWSQYTHDNGMNANSLEEGSDHTDENEEGWCDEGWDGQDDEE